MRRTSGYDVSSTGISRDIGRGSNTSDLGSRLANITARAKQRAEDAKSEVYHPSTSKSYSVKKSSSSSSTKTSSSFAQKNSSSFSHSSDYDPKSRASRLGDRLNALIDTYSTKTPSSILDTPHTYSNLCATDGRDSKVPLIQASRNLGKSYGNSMTNNIPDRYFGVEMEGFTRRSTKIMKIENIAEVLAENGLDIYFARYGDRSKSYNKWKIKPEDTITPPFGGYIGFELVSPILSGSAGLVELRNVLEVVKRVLKPFYDDTCGIHVHVQIPKTTDKIRVNDDSDTENTPSNASNDSNPSTYSISLDNTPSTTSDYQSIKLNTVISLSQLFVKYEDIFDLFLPIPRREDTNGYCRSIRHIKFTDNCNYSKLTNREINTLFNTADTLHNLVKMVNPGTPIRSILLNPKSTPSPARSYKMNLQNSFTLGTVEFRQHHGSFDGEEVGSWVRMLIGMVDKADVMSGQGSEVKAFKDERKANYKFEHFFKNVVVDEEVVEFYKRMREKYGTEWIDEL